MTTSLFSTMHHICIVVRDMDKAVDYYHSMGAGPFSLTTPIDIVKRKVHGKEVPVPNWKIKDFFGKMGNVWINLLQPIEGDSIFQEFLDTRGEGIHHFAFLVDDVEKEEAEFVEKGFKVLSSVRLINGCGHSIMDTAETGGIYIEVLQAPAEWIKLYPPLR
jgi:methylmalonyl-CoA/ethylmalonyl-CoA epimerase